MVDFVNQQPPLLLRDFRARIIDKPSTTINQTKRLSINRHNGEFEFPRVWTAAREVSEQAHETPGVCHSIFNSQPLAASPCAKFISMRTLD